MLTLVRVDEKLLHGQVLVGWGSALGISNYVVVDDHIAADEWERDLVLAGLPPESAGEVVTTADAAAQWEAWRRDDVRRGVLVAGIIELAALADAGATLSEVNVGGLRQRAGRREFLSYVQLDADEQRAALSLCERGVICWRRATFRGHSARTSVRCSERPQMPSSDRHTDLCPIQRKGAHAQP